MSTMGLLAVLLGVVFASAGVAKLFDRRGSRSAAESFGVPDRLAGGVAFGLPIAELAIAVLLLPAATRWWASVAAFALLLAFCSAIAIAMARGKSPECHCFGQLHSAPAGWQTLARNFVLVAIAGYIVIAGREDAGPGAFAWMSDVHGSEWLTLGLAVAVFATVAVGGYAVIHVIRIYGRVLVRLEAMEERLRAAGFELDESEEIHELGLEPGTPAPDFALTSIGGYEMRLADLRGEGTPVLLLFTSPSCGPCSVLMPTIAAWQRDHSEELTIALLSAGDAEAVRSEADAHGLVNVLLDEKLATYEAYEANGTPSAVLIGDDGNVASWLAAGSDWIESLVEQTLGGLGRTPGLPIGTELPDLELARLDGSSIDLRNAIEQDSVLLFWNPGCGFCRSLHEDVLAWEAAPPPDAPALVVVSAGEVVGVKAEGFASEVLLDPEWTASTALGADGTPMAVRVSADGRIASGVVGGGPAVLELLGARELVA